jgi:hypothetical protein
MLGHNPLISMAGRTLTFNMTKFESPKSPRLKQESLNSIKRQLDSMVSYGSSHILPPRIKPLKKSSSFLAVPRTHIVPLTPGVGTYFPNYKVISKHVPMPIIVQHSEKF